MVFFCEDFQHKITVQASPSHDRRRSLLSSGSSPQTSPPMLPRLRAIQRKHHRNLVFDVLDHYCHVGQNLFLNELGFPSSVIIHYRLFDVFP